MTIASAEGASENRIFHRKTTCAIIFFFKFQVEGGVPHLSPDSADAHVCSFTQKKHNTKHPLLSGRENTVEESGGEVLVQ